MKTGHHFELGVWVRWPALLIVTGLVLGLTPTAFAAVINWTNSLGGYYDDGNNWQGGSPPGPTDEANFTNATSYTVTWTNDATVSNADFSAASGTVTLDTDAKTWTVSGKVAVGTNGVLATVSLTNGTVSADNARIGSSAGSARGVLSVSGAGTVFTNAGNLQVGDLNSSNNELNVTGGAEVYCGTLYIGDSADYNRITINGTGSLLNVTGSVYMAYSSTGGANVSNELVVTNNGQFVAGGNFMMGQNSPWDTHERFVVSGTGSYAHVRYFYLQSDEHEFIVSDGGEVVLDYYIDIKSNSGGGHDCTVRVSGPGSALHLNTAGNVYLAAINTVSNRYLIEDGGMLTTSNHLMMQGNDNSVVVSGPGSGLRVGAPAALRNIYLKADTGKTISMIATNGASITNASIYVPESPGQGSATLAASGPGTRWYSSGVVCGWAAGMRMDLRVDDGAYAYAASAIFGRDSGSTGTVTVTGSGSEWISGGNVTLAQYPGSRGVLQVGDGGVAAMSSLTATNDATLSFVGGANDAGTLNVSGTLTINQNASLNVDLRELGSAAASQRIVLVNYGAMPTKFTASQITITSPYAEVDQVTGNQISVTIPQGTIIRIW